MWEMVLMQPEQQQQIQKQAEAYSSMLAQFQAYQITDAETYQFACEQVKAVKGQFKAWDEQEHSITKPINDGLKRARDMFRPVKAALYDIETVLKSKIAAFDFAQQQSRQQALNEAAKALQASETQAQGLMLLQQASTDAPKVQGVNGRKQVSFKVTDPNLVPREYCSVDEGKIRAAVKLGGAGTQIPGVRVYEEVVTYVRV